MIPIAIVIVTVAPSVCKWDSNRGLMREAALRFGCLIGRLFDQIEDVGPLGVPDLLPGRKQSCGDCESSFLTCCPPGSSRVASHSRLS